VITSRAVLPSSLALGLNLASTEIAKWLAGPKERSLEGRMISLDLSTRELRHHVLVKRPQCPRCGKPEESARAADAPVVLTSRKKRYTADGGHRTLTPGETFDRFKHHISPILGAVSDLQPALGARSELTPTFVAGHNFSMGAESIVFLRESLRGVSGGKGSTEIQAKVSGLCEAIERYSGIFWGDEPSLRGSYESLAPAAIHPNACMGFSEDQFQTREEWNRSQPFSRCTLVPRPFDPALEIDWTPLWSLTHRQVRYLPAAYCYYGHPEFAGRWCSPDSNGCAAGNTLEEAILQGFMELVERDAVALWWYNRIPRRGVDLDSFELPYLKQMQEYYRSLHREIWVLDVTSDLRITTLACVSRRMDRPTEDVLVGFGSHFDPRIAMLRAVTEVNQFLPSVAFTNPDGSTRYLFGDELARQWWRAARIDELDYLRPRDGLPPVALSDFEDLSTDDLRTDVETCVDLAAGRGIEVLVLDQTRPDIGLNVVRVAAPGLCHFWRRLGPRRLYEVPVEKGWLERPLSPGELNPFTVFF
jgi:ribosomal protein S12 methylthiotransferase accessory factor